MIYHYVIWTSKVLLSQRDCSKSPTASLRTLNFETFVYTRSGFHLNAKNIAEIPLGCRWRSVRRNTEREHHSSPTVITTVKPDGSLELSTKLPTKTQRCCVLQFYFDLFLCDLAGCRLNAMSLSLSCQELLFFLLSTSGVWGPPTRARHPCRHPVRLDSTFDELFPENSFADSVLI